MSVPAEILPPEGAARGPDGRFEKGASGNPNGRPAAALSFNTRAVRNAMMEALDQVSGGDGGVNYFMVLAATRPELFMPMLAKCMPVMAGDEDETKIQITAVRYIIPK